MSPEPLTPIDNNPPDESSIGHGGNPRHRQGTEGGPHTPPHKRARQDPTSYDPLPKTPIRHLKRTADLSKNSTRCLQTPLGITATLHAGRSRGTSPRAAPSLSALHKRCVAQPPGGSYMVLHPHPHQNLQPPPLSAPPPSPNGGRKRTWDMSVVASRELKRRLSRDARRVVMERGSI